ncbi:hypothetical protein FXV83_16835 [Bradyrhizobium hipponense]|uniref:Uncharacterized protein n=1 Tax=Bradyrhizobium hipponense TaxID=2605638 RepID=A0A5S4YMZ1_9BRAD|nr:MULTISPECIES: hypothetical protein [Bradyrhizobium]MDE5446846.1 hypothetical protein [Bradyrhizobium sp. CSA207]TYO65363.1 hypothetical protein FXV83_16835 [Bradyrhizobium hipponense]
MGQETHRPEWGNISQIVSALCALALAILAIYGFFFSKTSQAFVSYLQSELALRNIRMSNPCCHTARQQPSDAAKRLSRSPAKRA